MIEMIEVIEDLNIKEEIDQDLPIEEEVNSFLFL